MLTRKSKPVTRTAWALTLRSPFLQNSPVHSWFGGVPFAPPEFEWPRDETGLPLHFVAQINLASLRLPHGQSDWPKGIPNQGSLLAFTGATILLSPEENQRAVQIAPPTDLPSLRDVGFFGKESAFTYWPIDPQPFIDQAENNGTGRTQHPDIFPAPFKHPEDYITTAGLAALDAEIMLGAMAQIINTAINFFKHKKMPATEVPNARVQKVLADKTHFYNWALTHFIDALPTLRDWYNLQHSVAPASPVDRGELIKILELRRGLADNITYNDGGIIQSLQGSAHAIKNAINYNHFKVTTFQDYAALPQAYHDFMAHYISDWRGHRLLGFEPEFPNNSENTRGYSPLISVAADPLLGTTSEHEYGFSNWYKTSHLSKGRLDQCLHIKHCAV